MITEAILAGFKAIIMIILGLLPDLPTMGSTIVEAIDGFVDTIGDAVGVISYLYTPPIFVFVFTAILAIINFDLIYKFALWVVHKIRG